MIENQSDNIDIKENDVSNQDNAPEDSSSAEDKIIENDEIFSEKTEETVEAVEEGAEMKAVSVSHSDTADKASPVAGNAKAPTGATAHKTSGGDEKGRPAPAAKDMGMKGPQEAGDLSAAPKAKAEDNKSDSPIRGMK